MNSFYEQDYDNKPKFTRWDNICYWCSFGLLAAIIVTAIIYVVLKLIP